MMFIGITLFIIFGIWSVLSILNQKESDRLKKELRAEDRQRDFYINLVRELFERKLDSTKKVREFLVEYNLYKYSFNRIYSIPKEIIQEIDNDISSNFRFSYRDEKINRLFQEAIQSVIYNKFYNEYLALVLDHKRYMALANLINEHKRKLDMSKEIIANICV